MTSMGMGGVNWDEVEADEGRGGAPIPDDLYAVALTEFKVGPNKKNTGTIVKQEFTVMAGPFKGRKVYSQENTVHPTAQAQAIGRGRIKALFIATGKPPCDSLGVSMGIPFGARVGIDPERPNPLKPNNPYKARNRIDAFLTMATYKEQIKTERESGPSAEEKAAAHAAEEAKREAAEAAAAAAGGAPIHSELEDEIPF